MSTKTVEMYQAVCDDCGRVYEENIDGLVAWVESDQAIAAACQGGWEEENDGQLYCPDCWDKESEE